MKQRCWFWGILLLMVMIMLPEKVEAISVIDSGFCGADVNWKLEDDGTLTIYGEGAMYNYGSENDGDYSPPWEHYSYLIDTVYIDDGVTQVGDFAFMSYDLISVRLPDSITSIGDYAFAHTGLKNVVLQEGLTNIEDCAFYNCDQLTNVTIPKSVTSIGNGVFSSCAKLLGIWVDSDNRYFCNDTSGVLYTKDKKVLVAAPGSIKGSYSIPNGVVSVGFGAFINCTGLTSVSMPNGLKIIEYSAFSGCSCLRSVSIPNSVTRIEGAAFKTCSGLTSIAIPGSVTTIDASAFYMCTSLEYILFTGNAPVIWNATFYGVYALAYYPVGNPTWTADVRQNYGGGLTWKAYDPNGVLDDVVINKVIAHKTGNILYWDAVEFADIYQVYRLNGSKWELLKNTRSLGYKDAAAKVGVRYYYKIVARNGAAKSDIRTTVSASAVRPGTTLACVKVYKTIGHASGNILYWNAVSGAKIYQVYRLNGNKWELLKNTGSLAYKDTSAPAGVRCYYKIVARNGDAKSNIATTSSVSAIRPTSPKLTYPISEKACRTIFKNYYGYEMDEDGKRFTEVVRSGTGAEEHLSFYIYTLNPNTGAFNCWYPFVVYVNTGVCEYYQDRFNAGEYYY